MNTGCGGVTFTRARPIFQYAAWATASDANDNTNDAVNEQALLRDIIRPPKITLQSRRMDSLLMLPRVPAGVTRSRQKCAARFPGEREASASRWRGTTGGLTSPARQ